MIEIRRADPKDATAMTGLSGQLGYSGTTDQIGQRLARIHENPGHGVFVAIVGGVVVGWAHVAGVDPITVDAYAEIEGLVVEAGHREQGVGRALLEMLEVWARDRGYRALRVRSNIARPESHAFYARTGYRRIKTQHVYLKTLGRRVRNVGGPVTSGNLAKG